MFDKINASFAENVTAYSRDWAKRLVVIYSDWKEDSPDKGTLCEMILEPEKITRCIVDDIRNNNWHRDGHIYLNRELT